MFTSTSIYLTANAQVTVTKVEHPVSGEMEVFIAVWDTAGTVSQSYTLEELAYNVHPVTSETHHWAIQLAASGNVLLTLFERKDYGTNMLETLYNDMKKEVSA